MTNTTTTPALQVEAQPASDLVAHILVLRCTPVGSTTPLRQHYCLGYDDGIKDAAALAARPAPAVEASEVKPWAKRSFDDCSRMLATQYMQAEIDDLRAALASRQPVAAVEVGELAQQLQGRAKFLRDVRGSVKSADLMDRAAQCITTLQSK